jgi:hypothetical protein
MVLLFAKKSFIVSCLAGLAGLVKQPHGQASLDRGVISVIGVSPSLSLGGVSVAI